MKPLRAKPFALAVITLACSVHAQTPMAATKKDSREVTGVVKAPMILKDEGCARDYVRAYEYEGVELRKRLADLNTYGCIETKAAAYFTAISFDRKNLAVKPGAFAWFRYVTLKIDPERTGRSGMYLYQGKSSYAGWILDQDFTEDK